MRNSIIKNSPSRCCETGLPRIELDMIDPRVIREGLLQRKEDDGVRCLTCAHECHISEGNEGICGTRVNDDGTIKTLVYGNVSSLSYNPIEKKPFFHYAPGTFALTVGSWSCNATCGFCQNYHISKQKPTAEDTQFLSPEQFVDTARKRGAQGVSISFSEAATLMLEWNLDVFKLARENGMYNTIVTNGYMTSEALDLMIDAGLNAANVDVKGCEPEVRKICGIGLQPVLENIIHMKENGVHVEITTLVVPELSDTIECLDKISTWILENVGKKTPWHINFYHPDYKYLKQSPPLELHLEAREKVKSKGLEFVYIGNVGKRGLEDTVCPRCDTVNVERYAMVSRLVAVDSDGKCSNCGYDLAIDLITNEEDRDDNV